jgi:hypothetical protein
MVFSFSFLEENDKWVEDWYPSHLAHDAFIVNINSP